MSESVLTPVQQLWLKTIPDDDLNQGDALTLTMAERIARQMTRDEAVEAGSENAARLVESYAQRLPEEDPSWGGD